MKCRYERCRDDGLPDVGLCYAHHAIAIEFDLVDLVKATLQPTEPVQRAPRRPVGSRQLRRAKDYIGDRVFLYVMSRTDGSHKIGKSQNPDAREASLRITLCDPSVELVFACAVDDVLNRERAAHFILRDRLIRGEWFEVSQAAAIDVVLKVADGPLPSDLGNWRAPRMRRKFVYMSDSQADAYWRPKL